MIMHGEIIDKLSDLTVKISRLYSEVEFIREELLQIVRELEEEEKKH